MILRLLLLLLSAVGLLRAEEHDDTPGVLLDQPSAAARARAAAHAEKNPVTLNTWQWLTKATNAARGHDRWGNVLDAGTGPGSMSYLCAQPTETVVAVTAARTMSARLKMELKAPCKPVELLTNYSANGTVTGVVRKDGHPNTLLVGNWFGADHGGKRPLTEHPVYTAQKFDTVLAEYLLGALEHFAAFNEQKMMDLLVSSVKDDGLLLFCGRKPFDYPGPEPYKTEYNKAMQLVLDVERVRDAAMLLSHQREYREFPAWWVREALLQRGLEIVRQESFTGRVNIDYVKQQLDWARREARKVPAKSLSASLLEHIKGLQAAADAEAGLNKKDGVSFGGSYCIVARKPANSTSATTDLTGTQEECTEK